MHSPTILWIIVGLSMVVMVAFVIMAVTMTSHPSTPPQNNHGASTILGRDFSRILANPNVKLTMTARSETLVFNWSAQDGEQLDEIAELGLHIMQEKEKLEQQGAEDDQDKWKSVHGVIGF